MDIRNIEKEIKTRFTQKRLNAKKFADEFLENCLKNDEIKNVYEKYQDLKIEFAKMSALGRVEDCKKIKVQLKTEKEKMQKIMQKNKVDISKLKPKYECEKCSDNGYLDNEVCSCFKKELSKRLIEVSGIKKNKLPTFGSVNYDLIPEENQKQTMKKIVQLLSALCKKIDNTKIDLVLLSGAVGVGKTYLMECCVNELIESGKFVLYQTAFAMNQRLLKIHCGTLEEKEQLNEYLSCDVLCIDDLGTENLIKNVTIEYLYSIINERMMNNKKTFITTNLNISQLNDRYGERICSRIVDSSKCLKVDIQGLDIRMNWLKKRAK